MGRPKSFIACYVCSKEFGSQSISFHEPKCLERWRTTNKNLPADKRTSTPVKHKIAQNTTRVCPQCQNSVPMLEREKHSSVCPAKKLQSNNRSPNSKQKKGTGLTKLESSPKKGKENNLGHDSTKKNIRGKLNPIERNKVDVSKRGTDNNPPEVAVQQVTETSSTSKRSDRPQTKVLRRPTPNLNHPVIQIDSDDSSCSDKSKEENPKRQKVENDVSDSTHKTKNFIIYNKNNVEKNTKNASKERGSANATASIPNPCTSCSRSQAPERLHSHAKRDARGLMFRKSPSLDMKMASPQKKLPEVSEKSKTTNKDSRPHIQELVKDSASSSKQEKDVDRSPEPKKERLGVQRNASKEPNAQKSSKTNSKEENLRSLTDSKNETVEILKEPATDSKNKSLESQDSISTDVSKEIIKECYICQTAIKVADLLLHESKCLEDWKKTNNSLMPNLRQLPPRRPEESDHPTDQAWSNVQSQLVPCPVCSRTFFPERLPVHRRVCQGPRPLKRTSSLRERPTTAEEDDDESQNYSTYIPCTVCGRSYGSWVISMHEQQCLRESESLSRTEESPKSPSQLSKDADVASLLDLGNTAWESHLQQLVPCPLCHRTFFPGRLGIHQRSCKGSRTKGA